MGPAPSIPPAAGSDGREDTGELVLLLQDEKRRARQRLALVGAAIGVCVVGLVVGVVVDSILVPPDEIALAEKTDKPPIVAGAPADVQPQPAADARPGGGAPSTVATPGDDAAPAGDGTNGGGAATLDDEAAAERAERIERLVRRGRRFQRRHRWARARAMYQRAVAIDPDHERASSLLARALIRLDRGEEALALAQKVHRADPGAFGYLILLGDAHLAAGEREEARDAWLRARDMRPRHRGVRHRLRRL